MDKRFANEWVTEKNKVFRFDDVHCLLAFRIKNGSKGSVYINDYSVSNELVKATDMFFVRAQDLKSPMGGNVAAITNKASAEELLRNHPGRILLWSEVENEMKK